MTTKIATGTRFPLTKLRTSLATNYGFETKPFNLSNGLDERFLPLIQRYGLFSSQGFNDYEFRLGEKRQGRRMSIAYISNSPRGESAEEVEFLRMEDSRADIFISRTENSQEARLTYINKLIRSALARHHQVSYLGPFTENSISGDSPPIHEFGSSLKQDIPFELRSDFALEELAKFTIAIFG